MSRNAGRNNPLLKVVLLGDGGVGKSCLMNRFVSNQFDEQSFHTLGVEFLNKELDIDGQTYTLQIWDTAGQERFKTLRTPFYRGSDICMLTYAIDDKTSFRNLEQWRHEFAHYADLKEGNQVPFIVVGNKSDVPIEERQVTQLEMETWCNENGITSCIETSAKIACNVSEAFKMAVQQWLRLDARHVDIMNHDTVTLTQKSETKSSCCMGINKDNEQEQPQ